MKKKVHITVTNAEFYETLREDAEQGETNWTVSRHCIRGDTILLYVCAPVMAVVATAIMAEDATLNDDPASEWFGHYMADMHSLRMLGTPLARAELLEKFPAWGYWKQPRNCVGVPPIYAAPINELLEAHG